jgi:hypothetical protein
MNLGSGPLKSTFAVCGHIVQCKAVSAGLCSSKSKLANVAMDNMGQILRTPKSRDALADNMQECYLLTTGNSDEYPDSPPFGVYARQFNRLTLHEA